MSDSGGPISTYEDEVEQCGGLTTIWTYMTDWRGLRTLVCFRRYETRRRGNRFGGVSFEDALGAILTEIEKIDPDEAREFREAYESELWYGRPTWRNVLGDR